ncbi:hypothetical protein LCGC14_1854330, partial [marine sediment metagenome]
MVWGDQVIAVRVQAVPNLGMIWGQPTGTVTDQAAVTPTLVALADVAWVSLVTGKVHGGFHASHGLH